MIVWVMIAIVVCVLILLSIAGKRYEDTHHSDTNNDQPAWQHDSLPDIERDLNLRK